MQNFRVPLDDIRQAARGNWSVILQALGVHPDYLNTKKHGPCPHCGGRDRYRFTDYQGNGGFICNQCTPDGGTGFDLLMLAHGYGFTDAAQEVAAYLGLVPSGNRTSPRKLAPAPRPEPITSVDEQHKLIALLDECQPVTENTPVACYLMARGLDWAVISSGLESLFYHPALPYWYPSSKQDGHLLLAHYPAMIGAIRNVKGELVGLHKTYLQPDSNGLYRKLSALHPETGEPLPAKKMQTRYQGSLKGAAIQLYPMSLQDGRLAVCEGIETGLAVREMFGLPVYVCCTAWGMKNVDFPESLQELYIVADHDLTCTGLESARHLGIRGLKAKVRVSLWLPDNVGDDALDELNRREKGGRA